MKRCVIRLAQALLLFLYTLFRHLPHHRRIVCCSRESDTPSTDFILIRDYVARAHPGYDVVIMSKTLDSPITYAFHMLRQLYYIATSDAVVLDTYAPTISLLAGHIRIPVIQMWHALGNMKRFGYTALQDSEGRGSNAAALLNMHRGYTSVLISSMSFIDDYAAGFGIDKSLIYEAPLPRTDLLVDPRNRSVQRERLLRKYPMLAGKRNIVYCPTFRKRTPSNQKKAWSDLASAVDFNRYNLILKAHPLDDTRFDDPRVIQNYSDKDNMLFAADYVISDYSTVIYEAGLIGAPVFLYGYDWAEYSSRRSLYIDPERDIPTLFTDDARAIMHAIENDDFDADAYAAFIARNITLPEHGTCTARVVDHIFDLIRRNRRTK